MDGKCANDPMGKKDKCRWGWKLRFSRYPCISSYGSKNACGLRFKLAVILYNLEGDEKLCLKGIAERKESKQIH